MQPCRLIRGSTPLIVSIPHMGTFIPPDIKSRMTDTGRAMPDTDWHLDRLYGFAREMGASILFSAYSRYVIDLNRPNDDTTLYAGQIKTGLVPLQSFSGENLYIDGEEPDGAETVNRISAYWQPYHDVLTEEIDRIKAAHGYVMLYDAHSIKSVVPRLFDGMLPDLNIGTVHTSSCAAGMETVVMQVAENSGYSAVSNGRFIGGHITRAYGCPQEDIHALQMELACKNYMDEKTFSYDAEKSAQLSLTLRAILSAMLAWGESAYISSSNEK